MQNFIEFSPHYTSRLLSYFDGLSDETKKRFGPHPFTREALENLYENHKEYLLFLATNNDNTVIAYTIIKMGWLDFDAERLQSYGLSPLAGDCTLAPSVADQWQNKGIGSSFLNYILKRLKKEHDTSRIILWGGVQSNNNQAIGLYKKFGFITLGTFEHNGTNYDMLLNL